MRPVRAALGALASMLALVAYASPAAAHRCDETGTYVGEEVCRRFGSGWSDEGTTPASVELQGATISTGLDGRGLRLTRPHHEDGTRISATDLGVASLTTYGFGFDARLFFALPFFVSAGSTIGFGALAPRQLGRLDASLRDAAVNVVTFDLSLGAGAMIPLTERVALRLEGGAFVRVVSIAATYLGEEAAANNAWILPRVGAAIVVRPTPWSSFGLAYAQSPLSFGDRVIGLTVGLHGTAFDGL